MKASFFDFFAILSISLLFGLELHAQDSTPTVPTLTASSTSDDVLAAVDQLARNQIDTGKKEPKAAEALKMQMARVDHKALIDAAMRIPTDVKGENEKRYTIEANVLKDNIYRIITTADLPYLLNYSDKSPRQQLKGLWLALLDNKGWANESATTSYLLSSIQAAEGNIPHVQENEAWGSSLNVMNHSADAKIAAALSSLIDKVTMGGNLDETKADLLNRFADMFTRPESPHFELLTPCLVALIHYPDTKRNTPITFWIARALQYHHDLVNDSKFTATSLGYLNDSPEKLQPNRDDGTFARAYLGDKAGLVKVVSNHFLPPAGATPGDIKHQAEQEKALLKFVLYSGPGDKWEALKDHAQEAVYHNGVWSLAISGFRPPEIPGTPTKVESVSPATSLTSAPTVSGGIPASVTPIPITVVTAAPIETFSEDGTMLSVNRATVGKIYQLLRTEQGKAVLQDDGGHVLKIDATAVRPVAK